MVMMREYSAALSGLEKEEGRRVAYRGLTPPGYKTDVPSGLTR